MERSALKTYKQKSTSRRRQSVDVFNALFAENIIKRKQIEHHCKKGTAKPLKLKELPVAARTGNLSDSSLHVFEDSFDKIRKGETYNNVNFKPNPKYVSDSDSDLSTQQIKQGESSNVRVLRSKRKTRAIPCDANSDKIFKEPQRITVSNIIHEPTLSISIESKSAQLPNKSEDTLDKSIDNSLYVESEPFYKISFVPPKEANELNVTGFNDSEVCNSTPIKPIAARKLACNIISPIKNLPVEPSLIEKSYAEIEEWDHRLPDFKAPSRGPVSVNSNRNLPKSTKKKSRLKLFSSSPQGAIQKDCKSKNKAKKKDVVEVISAEEFIRTDWKLQADSRVVLTNHLDVLGINSSVRTPVKKNADRSFGRKTNSSWNADIIESTFSSFSERMKRARQTSRRRKYWLVPTPRIVSREIQNTVEKITESTRRGRRKAMIFVPQDMSTLNNSWETLAGFEQESKSPQCPKILFQSTHSEASSRLGSAFGYLRSKRNNTSDIECIRIDDTSDDDSCYIVEDSLDAANVQFRKSINLAENSTSQDVRNILTEHSYSEKCTIDQKNTVGSISLVDETVETSDLSELKDFQGLLPKIPLKPGKSWRRSLALHKRKDLNNDFHNYSANKSVEVSIISNWKLSVKCYSSTNRRTSLLEDYVLSKCYGASVRATPAEETTQEPSSNQSNDTINTHETPSPSPIVREPVITKNHPSARDLVLKKCGQTEPLPFEECYPDSSLKKCFKIGEGVYGEVFLLKDSSGGTTVMKVVPVEGQLLVNGEHQKKFEEILSEITIAMELSNLRKKGKNKTSSFSQVKRVRCVKGRYPSRLVELWELFEENKGSENDSPEIFDQDQLYIVLELVNGGQDMESFVFHNAQQAYSLLKQTACALAVAESSLQFEHRDLHWGNVLAISTNKHTYITYHLDGKELVVQSYGVEACIIDFTLSRIDVDGVTIYNDLGQDPDLFSGTGDYQFEIYRLMQKHNNDNWHDFQPYSNVLWVHYLIDKMIKGLRYKGVNTKIHQQHIDKLVALKDGVLQYKSMKEAVSCNFI